MVKGPAIFPGAQGEVNRLHCEKRKPANPHVKEAGTTKCLAFFLEKLSIDYQSSSHSFNRVIFSALLSMPCMLWKLAYLSIKVEFG